MRRRYRESTPLAIGRRGLAPLSCAHCLAAGVSGARDTPRARLAEVWQWWHDQPDGDARVKAARWYSEWTGAAMPFRGGLEPGPQSPGFGCASDEEAYERYVGFLEAKYEPGRLGPPLPALSDDAGRVAPGSAMRRPS